MSTITSRLRTTTRRAGRQAVDRAKQFLDPTPPPNRPASPDARLRDVFSWVRSQGVGGRYPQYVWSTLLAARTAHNLDIPAIAVAEFGVAGGNGLVALESAAGAAEDFYGIRIECFGFDSATGLPAPEDYRDVPHQLREGDFRMDEPALRARLHRSELVLGLVQETVPRFLEAAHPPLGFASIDLDYYSSTVHALRLLDAPPKRLLPRVVFYFDDLHGWMYSEINGEAAAIADFNTAHEHRKLAEVKALHYDLPKTEHDLPWPEQIYIAHILDHSEYGTPERGEKHPTEHHVRLRD
jgi:hypothetical protein